VILLRAALFSLFTAAIWALLPLTANEDLHLGSGGYALLLGGVGVGAVAGAALLPRLRGRLTPGAMLAGGSVGLALVALLMAYVHVTGILLLGLIAGGMCWIISLSTLNSLYQMALPRWVKTRGSTTLLPFRGGAHSGAQSWGWLRSTPACRGHCRVQIPLRDECCKQLTPGIEHRFPGLTITQGVRPP
jgi:hypothetical protein